MGLCALEQSALSGVISVLNISVGDYRLATTVTIALRKRTLSPVRLVLMVTFFCCYLQQWCFFVFLGSIN